MAESAVLKARRYRDEGDLERVEVTREQVLEAIRAYDAEYPKNDYCDKGRPPWLEDESPVAAYNWAVWHEGRCYPGKHILRCATGYEQFHGGWGAGEANDVFELLGFQVTPRPRLGRD